MAKSNLYSNKKQVKIIFLEPVENSNHLVKWNKIILTLPPSKDITFQHLHNSFSSLDTTDYRVVLDTLELSQYITSETYYGQVEDYKSLEGDIVYYIK
jgi:uncharacterized protein YfbU (UPF0304 family)